MPRLMAVSLTVEQVRNRTKTVTRRLGWRMLREGDQLTLCAKVMGRTSGEPLDRIVTVEVTSVRREPLDAITAEDVIAEGFPQMTGPDEFVRFYCATHKGCTPRSEVTRIAWRYLDRPGSQNAGYPETRKKRPAEHDLAAARTRLAAVTSWIAAREGSVPPSPEAIDAAALIIATPRRHQDVSSMISLAKVWRVNGHLVAIYRHSGPSGGPTGPVVTAECSCPATSVCEHLLVALAETKECQ